MDGHMFRIRLHACREKVVMSAAAALSKTALIITALLDICRTLVLAKKEGQLCEALALAFQILKDASLVIDQADTPDLQADAISLIRYTSHVAVPHCIMILVLQCALRASGCIFTMVHLESAASWYSCTNSMYLYGLIN
jgi:hypothetical protein